VSRDELIDMILDARSEEEIEIAEREADAWLEDYPDDVGIAAACEQLEMMRMASGID
jgi:uncharacterized protein with von Willebrand factor type A (vWA) domain